MVQKNEKEQAQQRPFVKIPAASKLTGLSQCAIRKGCRAGTIPHIKNGTVYLIDVDGLMEQMRQAAAESVKK